MTDTRQTRRMVRHARRGSLRKTYADTRRRGYASTRSLDWPWDSLTWLSALDRVRP